MLIPLCGIQDASSEEVKASAAVHPSLQHLEGADLPFDGSGGPRRLERCADRVEVATELRRKPRKQGALRCIEYLTEISGHLTSEERIEALGPEDSGAERRLLLKETGPEQVVLGLQRR